MKRIIFLISLALIFFQSSNLSFAQLPDSDQLQKINDKVDELKDKVASKVAELNLVEKRGVVGTVVSVDANQITLNDVFNNDRIIDVDELTQFTSDNNSSFNISDLKKGSQISALGIYNKDSQRILARFINSTSIPIFLSGVISEINQDDFTITILTEGGTKYLVDVERVTKSFSYIDENLESSGFSKLTIGENVLVSGYKNAKEKNRISASRLIDFPGVPRDPNVKIEITTASPSLTPSK